MTFRVIIYAVLLKSFATSQTVTLKTESSGSKCTTKFGLCDVEAGNEEYGPLVALGEDAPMGPIGEKGPIGDKGPVGNPGYSASCGCQVSVSEADSASTSEAPLQEICRNIYTDTSGKMNIYLGPMEVSCDKITKATCPTITTEGKVVEYTEAKPFWLGEYVTMKQIYGLECDQLTWLQRESYGANLTIRYHCMNSNPAGMLLLMWNDQVVGPTPTESTPFHYRVHNDHCRSAKKNTWSYTDFVLDSTGERLPIKDFLIKDVRNGNQAVKIEIKELCYK